MNPLFVDLAIFAGTVAVAIHEDWRAPDLVWSLWLSSLIVGYACIITIIFKATFWPGRFTTKIWPTVFSPTASIFKRLLGGVFLGGFFSIHFIGFHAGHAVFLYNTLPLPGGVRALLGFWPFVLATAVSLRGWFLQDGGVLNIAAPYLNVVKMHVFILLFLPVGLGNVSGERALMVLALFMFFFPWLVARELWAASRSAVGRRWFWSR